MPHPDESFFHRKHYVSAFWVVVTAVISMGVTMPLTAWYTRRESKDDPPQRVFVVNTDTTRRIVVEDSDAHREIADLRRQFDSLRSEPAHKARSDSAYEFHKERTSVGSIPSGPVDFVLPSTVRGEEIGDANSLLASGCPATREKPGTLVSVSVSPRAEMDVAAYSPLIVRLLEPKTGNSVLQLYKAVLTLRPTNDFSIQLPDKAGHYQIEFGVYPLQQLTKDYPTFFRRACEIDIS